MAEMNTVQSYVLNCELYKVLEMKVDDLRSTVAGADNIDAMRLENQILRSELAIFEDSMARAIYDLKELAANHTPSSSIFLCLPNRAESEACGDQAKSPCD
ncbi:Uncharacterized protein Fot_14957 [Forsythia ovata]|uniref:Uncharacterized protein n=1 Tax=Forsythia ovata TaxID=205694 RepID=A0ABD1W7U2_9LAMI